MKVSKRLAKKERMFMIATHITDSISILDNI